MNCSNAFSRRRSCILRSCISISRSLRFSSTASSARMIASFCAAIMSSSFSMKRSISMMSRTGSASSSRILRLSSKNRSLRAYSASSFSSSSIRARRARPNSVFAWPSVFSFRSRMLCILYRNLAMTHYSESAKSPSNNCSVSSYVNFSSVVCIRKSFTASIFEIA